MGNGVGDLSRAPAHRLGLLGGTFDPPHYGHLIAAEEAAWRLNLERVLFLPARQNPLKRNEAISGGDHRCRMVELATADNPRLAVSRLDLDRPPPSYTVDLLRLVRREQGPDVELFFLLGSDIVPELPAWQEPAAVLELATVVIITRPGSWGSPEASALAQRLPGIRSRTRELMTPGVDISSSEIRARVRAGQSVRYLTPPAVEMYIRANGLYADSAT